MIKPKTISVIIPTYNPNPDFLEKTLKSIDKQTIKPKDVIVVENGKGGEKTQEIVEDYFGFDYVWNSKAGANLARNTGADIAEGDIFFFTDDDCILKNDCLEQHLKTHQERLCLLGGMVSLQFLKTPPIWMSEPFEHMLAMLDYRENNVLNDAIIDITDDKYKYLVSANMSIPQQLFDAVNGFDDSDGYVGKIKLTANDEFELISRCRRMKNVKVLFSSYAKLDHLIPKERITEDYFMRRFYGQAIADGKTCLKRGEVNEVYPPVDPDDVETIITNTILRWQFCSNQHETILNNAKKVKTKEEMREVTRVYMMCLAEYIRGLKDFINERSKICRYRCG